MVLSMAASAQTSKWLALQATADTLFKQERYAEAQVYYTRLIKEAAKRKQAPSLAIIYKRAVCYFTQEAYAEALVDIQYFIDQNPDFAQARILRGLIYRARGETAAQLPDVQAVLKLLGANAALLKWRAELYLQLEKFDSARADLLFLRRVARDPEVEANLGILYTETDQPDSARFAFERAIEEDATFLPAYLYLIPVLLELEAYEDALTYLRLVRSIDPANAQWIFYQGVAWAETGRVEAACSAFRRAFAAGIDQASAYLQEYCWQAKE